MQEVVDFMELSISFVEKWFHWDVNLTFRKLICTHSSGEIMIFNQLPFQVILENSECAIKWTTARREGKPDQLAEWSRKSKYTFIVSWFTRPLISEGLFFLYYINCSFFLLGLASRCRSSLHSSRFFLLPFILWYSLKQGMWRWGKKSE